MNGIAEFFVFFGLFWYYVLEAIVLLFVPKSYRKKNVKGQRVLITGAGMYVCYAVLFLEKRLNASGTQHIQGNPGADSKLFGWF